MSRKEDLELARKVGVLGLGDLRKLAPIGDLGYANGWDFYSGFFKSDLPIAIMKAFWEQKEKYGWTVECYSSRWRNTDNSYYCPELGLRWSIDSGD